METGRRVFPETEIPPVFGKEERPPILTTVLLPLKGAVVYFLGAYHAPVIKRMFFYAFNGIIPDHLHSMAAGRIISPR